MSKRRPKIQADLPVKDETVWILFSGSRSATPAMLRYTTNAVQHAIKNGWTILVGDNPEGIDYQVIAVCQTMNAPYIVVSVEGEERAIRKLRGEQGVTSEHTAQDYSERDAFMVGMASKGMFIWNGKSKGTKEAHDAMARRWEVETFLVDFSSGEGQLTRSFCEHPKAEFEQPVEVVKQKKMF